MCVNCLTVKVCFGFGNNGVCFAVSIREEEIIGLTDEEGNVQGL